jgi:hypothetical protein
VRVSAYALEKSPGTIRFRLTIDGRLHDLSRGALECLVRLALEELSKFTAHQPKDEDEKLG